MIAGTRPECIKLAPLVRRLAGDDRLRMVLVNSGQHCLAVRRTFAEFDIRCDIGHVVEQTLLQQAYA